MLEAGTSRNIVYYRCLRGQILSGRQMTVLPGTYTAERCRSGPFQSCRLSFIQGLDAVQFARPERSLRAPGSALRPRCFRRSYPSSTRARQPALRGRLECRHPDRANPAQLVQLPLLLQQRYAGPFHFRCAAGIGLSAKPILRHPGDRNSQMGILRRARRAVRSAESAGRPSRGHSRPILAPGQQPVFPRRSPPVGQARRPRSPQHRPAPAAACPCASTCSAGSWYEHQLAEHLSGFQRLVRLSNPLERQDGIDDRLQLAVCHQAHHGFEFIAG